MKLISAQHLGAPILVVDDDALITLNNVDILSELGYTPIEAFSGREALEILRSRSDIAAMITDFSMPGMTGVELAEAARQIHANLPIILATGYAELPNGTPCDFPRLEKPFRQEELFSKLEALLAGLNSLPKS